MEVDEDQLAQEEPTAGEIINEQKKELTPTIEISTETPTRSITPTLKLNDSQFTEEEKKTNQTKSSKIATTIKISSMSVDNESIGIPYNDDKPENITDNLPSLPPDTKNRITYWLKKTFRKRKKKKKNEQ